MNRRTLIATFLGVTLSSPIMAETAISRSCQTPVEAAKNHNQETFPPSEELGPCSIECKLDYQGCLGVVRATRQCNEEAAKGWTRVWLHYCRGDSECVEWARGVRDEMDAWLKDEHFYAESWCRAGWYNCFHDFCVGLP